MGERKDLKDLLRDTDFTQKRIIDDLANSGIESYNDKDISGEIRRREGGDFIRNFFVGILLIGIVVGSFWASFLIGKKVLVPPVKNLPTYEAPIPKAVSKTELESATPVKEEEVAPLPEKEIREIDAKQGLPKPVTLLKPDEVQRPVAVAKPVTLPRSLPTVAEKTSTGKFYKVIVGSYKSIADAKTIISALKKKGIQTFSRKTSAGLYRVQAGAFDTREKAAPMLAKLKAGGFSPVVILE
jgi:hypothetical protein